MTGVIVVEFVTLDGVMQDPDGSQGTTGGAWAFAHGPGPVAGDKFNLGAILDTGALLLGRSTWQQFAKLWPTRDDEFSQKMNRIPKLVASRSLERVAEWNNSTLLTGELVEEVSHRKANQDIVVIGSASVVDALAEHDLVDEYRLIVFPTVLGRGRRVFESGTSIDLELVSVEALHPTVRLIYRRRAAA